MPNIQDLSLEIQHMILQHMGIMRKYILCTTPSEVQQVYPIYLEFKIIDDRVILHCIKEYQQATEFEYFKQSVTEEPFVVTSVPKKFCLCSGNDGLYEINNGVVTHFTKRVRDLY